MRNKWEIRGTDLVIFIHGSEDEVIEAVTDADALSELVNFDVTWGILRRHHCRGYVIAQPCVGHKRSSLVYLHRFLMNPPKELVVDHINGNGLDNRKSNLRVVTQAQNSQNRHGVQTNNKSGVLGVRWNSEKERWIASIQSYGISHHVGYFKDLRSAEVAVKQARTQLMEFGHIVKEPRNTSSTYRGVYWSKRSKRWKVSIRAEGEKKHLGYFDSEIEAAIAYDKAAILYRGNQAKLNFPEKMTSVSTTFRSSVGR